MRGQDHASPRCKAESPINGNKKDTHRDGILVEDDVVGEAASHARNPGSVRCLPTALKQVLDNKASPSVVNEVNGLARLDGGCAMRKLCDTSPDFGADTVTRRSPVTNSLLSKRLTGGGLECQGSSVRPQLDGGI